MDALQTWLLAFFILGALLFGAAFALHLYVKVGWFLAALPFIIWCILLIVAVIFILRSMVVA